MWCYTMKDSTVSARVEYKIKTEAEDILQKLGIPVFCFNQLTLSSGHLYPWSAFFSYYTNRASNTRCPV